MENRFVSELSRFWLSRKSRPAIRKIVPMRDTYNSKATEKTSKEQEREKVERDIAEFLKKGKITQIPNGMSGEKYQKPGS